MRRVITVGIVLVIVGSLSVLPAFANGTDNPKACWGQASSEFAQMGEMGEHASSFETPRVGLRNLARSLHDAGALEDDSMQSLGVFVAQAEGLEVAACDPESR